MALKAEQRVARDELVAVLLARVPDGITEYELHRRLRAELRMPDDGLRYGSGTGRDSLRRLEAAGRARHETEPHPGVHGFRRVWYPVGERP